MGCAALALAGLTSFMTEPHVAGAGGTGGLAKPTLARQPGLGRHGAAVPSRLLRGLVAGVAGGLVQVGSGRRGRQRGAVTVPAARRAARPQRAPGPGEPGPAAQCAAGPESAARALCHDHQCGAQGDPSHGA